MRQRLPLISVACLFAVAAGCGQSSDDSAKEPESGDALPREIPTTPLAGNVAGAAWQIASGTARAQPGGTGGRLSLNFSDTATATPCDPFTMPAAKGRSVMGSVPASAGVYDFTMATHQLLTFSYKDGDGAFANHIGEGRIIVDEVTAEEVKGRMAFAYDAKESVSGAFTAKRCNDSRSYTPEDDFPKGGAADPRLAGAWTSPQIILGTESGWTWNLTATDAETFAIQLVTDGGDIIEDAEERWRFDAASTPNRVIREVIASRKSVNGLKRVGDKAYCAYAVSGDGPDRKIVVNCGGRAFPQRAENVDGGEIYTPR